MRLGYNLDDGTWGLARATSCSSAADKRQTTWTNDLPFERVGDDLGINRMAFRFSPEPRPVSFKAVSTYCLNLDDTDR